MATTLWHPTKFTSHKAGTRQINIFEKFLGIDFIILGLVVRNSSDVKRRQFILTIGGHLAMTQEGGKDEV